MRIRDIPRADLDRYLSTGGLDLCLGPFVMRLKLAYGALREAFADVYGACLAAPPGEEITDFHVRIDAPSRWRHWFRPQAIADIDSPAPFVPLPARLAPLMLEQGMNWCVATRVFNLLTFHASVVERGGKAILFPGRSGAGKSTLCAGLAVNGWRLFCDEFVLLDMENGEVRAYPRPISLKNRSIGLIRAMAPAGAISASYPDTPKGTIAFLKPPEQSVARDQEPAELGAFIVPVFDPGEPAAISRLSKTEALGYMTLYSMNYDRLGAPAFTCLTDLVERRPAFALRYPDLEVAMAQVDDIHRSL